MWTRVQRLEAGLWSDELDLALIDSRNAQEKPAERRVTAVLIGCEAIQHRNFETSGLKCLMVMRAQVVVH